VKNLIDDYDRAVCKLCADTIGRFGKLTETHGARGKKMLTSYFAIISAFVEGAAMLLAALPDDGGATHVEPIPPPATVTIPLDDAIQLRNSTCASICTCETRERLRAAIEAAEQETQ
jgi:hypothetical protein